MNKLYVLFFRFLLFAVLQVFVFNQLNISSYVHIMIAPLYIMILPFDFSIFRLLIISFFLGAIIDVLSNTFGLHASALVLMAYLRPTVFNWLAPRDGYDPLKTPSIIEMPKKWFLLVFGILLSVHHLWFFAIESFSLSEILLILQKTFFSCLLSFLVCIILQPLFLNKAK